MFLCWLSSLHVKLTPRCAEEGVTFDPHVSDMVSFAVWGTYILTLSQYGFRSHDFDPWLWSVWYVLIQLIWAFAMIPLIWSVWYHPLIGFCLLSILLWYSDMRFDWYMFWLIWDDCFVMDSICLICFVWCPSLLTTHGGTMGVSLRHQWHDTIWGGVISPRRPHLFMIWYELTWPICICLWGAYGCILGFVCLIWYMIMICFVWWLAARVLCPFHVWYLGVAPLCTPYVLTDMWLCVWDLFEWLG